MLKTKVVIAIALAAALAAGALAFIIAAQPPTGQYEFGAQKGKQWGKQTVDTRTSHTEQTSLTPEEIAAVLYMREVEKLARDLYLTLYNATGEKIFLNLAESEQRHMDAVLAIIQKYGLPDPAGSVGEFKNLKIAELYNTLLARASGGLLDALLAAAYVEEHDIVDLREMLTYVQNPDVRKVFQNLLDASANHLKSLVREIETRFCVKYRPQLLTEEELSQILQRARGGGPTAT